VVVKASKNIKGLYMKRARRTRMSTNKPQVVRDLVNMIINDDRLFKAVETNDTKLAFGRLLNKWLDKESKESVIDRYIDSEAMDAVNHAINIIKKSLKDI
jgi:hypothetical protein